MSDTTETLAAILAEMRADVADGENAFFIRADWLALCDRIEAAVERRVKEAKDSVWQSADEIHDLHCTDCTLREALVEIIDRTNREKARNYKAALDGGILEIHDIAATALHETKGE